MEDGCAFSSDEKGTVMQRDVCVCTRVAAAASSSSSSSQSMLNALTCAMPTIDAVIDTPHQPEDVFAALARHIARALKISSADFFAPKMTDPRNQA
jgi:hypothetical protein